MTTRTEADEEQHHGSESDDTRQSCALFLEQDEEENDSVQEQQQRKEDEEQGSCLSWSLEGYETWQKELAGTQESALSHSQSQQQLSCTQEVLTQNPDFLSQQVDDDTLSPFPGSSAALSPLLAVVNEREQPWARLMPCGDPSLQSAIPLLPKSPNPRQRQLHNNDSTTAGIALLGLLDLSTGDILNEFVIGRSSKADITVSKYTGATDAKLQALHHWAHAIISNRHCRIYCRLTTTDNHNNNNNKTLHAYLENYSKNGVLINRTIKLQKGQTTLLRSGDEICLCNPETLARKIQSAATLQHVLQQQSFIFVSYLPPPNNSPAPPFPPMLSPALHNTHYCRTQANSTTAANTIIPRRFEDDYQMAELLGSGTVGQVYRAIHRTTGQDRAVKRIQWTPGFTHNRRTSANKPQPPHPWQAEAKILQQLRHPYIVNLIQVYSSNHTLYLVMDLQTGGDLFDRIILRQRYTESKARQLLRRLLAAVSYLHDECNIVHRDLKPENILLVSRDDDVHICLTDFGLAKEEHGNCKTFCGTPQYFAPEVLQRSRTLKGNGRYGKPADMWSVGVILYILLSGTPPFSTFEYHEPLEFPTEDWEHVSDDARDLITKLLVTDPCHRYTVAQACQHAWILTEDGDTHVHPLQDPALQQQQHPKRNNNEQKGTTTARTLSSLIIQPKVRGHNCISSPNENVSSIDHHSHSSPMDDNDNDKVVVQQEPAPPKIFSAAHMLTPKRPSAQKKLKLQTHDDAADDDSEFLSLLPTDTTNDCPEMLLSSTTKQSQSLVVEQQQTNCRCPPPAESTAFLPQMTPPKKSQTNTTAMSLEFLSIPDTTTNDLNQRSSEEPHMKPQSLLMEQEKCKQSQEPIRPMTQTDAVQSVAMDRTMDSLSFQDTTKNSDHGDSEKCNAEQQSSVNEETHISTAPAYFMTTPVTTAGQPISKEPETNVDDMESDTSKNSRQTGNALSPNPVAAIPMESNRDVLSQQFSLEHTMLTPPPTVSTASSRAAPITATTCKKATLLIPRTRKGRQDAAAAQRAPQTDAELSAETTTTKNKADAATAAVPPVSLLSHTLRLRQAPPKRGAKRERQGEGDNNITRADLKKRQRTNNKIKASDTSSDPLQLAITTKDQVIRPSSPLLKREESISSRRVSDESEYKRDILITSSMTQPPLSPTNVNGRPQAFRLLMVEQAANERKGKNTTKSLNGVASGVQDDEDDILSKFSEQTESISSFGNFSRDSHTKPIPSATTTTTTTMTVLNSQSLFAAANIAIPPSKPKKKNNAKRPTQHDNTTKKKKAMPAKTNHSNKPVATKPRQTTLSAWCATKTDPS